MSWPSPLVRATLVEIALVRHRTQARCWSSTGSAWSRSSQRALPTNRSATASTTAPASSPTCLRGANCDHSRSMRARTQVWIRGTLGKRIR
jgi:hypothetical protein